jgi:hypothetical protein
VVIDVFRDSIAKRTKVQLLILVRVRASFLGLCLWGIDGC